MVALGWVIAIGIGSAIVGGTIGMIITALLVAAKEGENKNVD